VAARWEGGCQEGKRKTTNNWASNGRDRRGKKGEGALVEVGGRGEAVQHCQNTLNGRAIEKHQYHKKSGRLRFKIAWG